MLKKNLLKSRKSKRNLIYKLKDMHQKCSTDASQWLPLNLEEWDILSSFNFLGRLWNLLHIWFVSQINQLTFNLAAFYAAVGSLYYVIYKSDFEMASAKDLFH
jgi:hypothetical protein